jgi:argininosuccinate lyase
MSFHPTYIRLVLSENFEDAKRLLLEPLLAIHDAHLVMLAERRIISREQARSLRAALATIDAGAIAATPFDGWSEDLFFHVETLIAGACDEDTAGRLHTARSRNDIDMTMYRMQVREWVLALADATLELRRTLGDIAGRHVATVFPANTHTQPAQPSTLAHYLLGAIEELERHTTRLIAAYASVNRCPLGACAITGTAFPIDRTRTSDLLGFDEPTGNTYGSIAAVDDLLASAAAASNLAVGLGRLVQDLLQWCTADVGWLRLPDGFVQVSSIMPQKRNPVALEHARSLASKAVAQAAAIQVVVHNTPFGDIVDTEDDLQPLVASAFKDTTRAVGLVAAAMAGATFDVAKMRGRAAEGWVTLTELADTLARDHGLAFKHAHAIAASLVHGRAAEPMAKISDLVANASREVAGREIRLSEDALAKILSPEHFVEVRKTLGGPAAEVTKAALAESAARLNADAKTLDERRRQLTVADARRQQAVETI